MQSAQSEIYSIRTGIADINNEMNDLIERKQTNSKRYKDLMNEYTAAHSELRRLEVRAEIDDRLGSRLPQSPINTGQAQFESREQKEYRENFRRFLWTGERSGLQTEKRDLGIATATQSTATGVLVPQGFMTELETALKYYGPMLRIARTVTTENGAPLPWPTATDVAETASIVGEGSINTESDPTISSLIFQAWKYSTGIVKVSLELMQDSAFDLEGWLREQFAIRLGRALNTHFTTGTGTGQPKGVIAAATEGPTAVGSSGNDGGSGTAANSIGSDDLVALEHSVDPLYRMGASYMAHDDTIKFLQQLKDKYGRPLYEQPQQGQPLVVNGYPIYANNDMDQIATTKKTLAFGQFQKFIIRKVKDLSILRLVERYADYGQIAFIGFARYDGNLLDAGTHPIKYLVQG